MSEDVIGIVIDNGSKWTKAGFSGESFPRSIIPTAVGRENIAEIMFESFTVKDLYLASSPVLVLNATGRTTGIVWECGDSSSYVTPVFEGFPLKTATVCSGVNGKVLTKYFQKMLSNVGYSFTTPMEIDILEKAKIDLCYIANNYEKEIKEALYNKEKTQYKLPDGQHILVGEEKFKCPELLFTPEPQEMKYTSIADDIYNCLTQCDLDYKSTFYNNIVLSGGGTMFAGLPERLHMELCKRMYMSPEARIFVESPTSRNVVPWIGGSILASMKTGNGFWLNRDEYNNTGTEAVHYKFLL